MAALVAGLFLAAPAWGTCHTASFDPLDYVVGEEDGSVTVTVRNPGPGIMNRTVDYETVSEQASAGADFVAASGTLSFTPTQTVRGFDITIVNDTKDEPDELFLVRLIPREGSCISQPGEPATITITDDDDPASPAAGKAKPKKPVGETSSAVPPAQTPSPTPSRRQHASAPRPRREPADFYARRSTSRPDDRGGGLFGNVTGWSIATAIILGGGTGAWVWRRFGGAAMTGYD